MYVLFFHVSSYSSAKIIKISQGWHSRSQVHTAMFSWGTTECSFFLNFDPRSLHARLVDVAILLQLHVTLIHD